MLDKSQKVLAHFQRRSIVEREDITESSDNLRDYYKPNTNASNLMDADLGKFIDKPLSRLDKVLLLGVYTSSAAELRRVHDQHQID